MRLPTTVRLSILAVFLALAASSCSDYATATTRRLSYHSTTSAGEIISGKLQHPSRDSLAQIGGYLDAASSAKAALKRNPRDLQAQADYNFSVGRIIEAINDSGLQPWKAPLLCPGANGKWIFSFRTAQYRGWDAADFELRPADRYDFKGRLIAQRSIKAGLGAPVVATSQGIDLTKTDQFAQGKHIYYGLTALIDFHGDRCVASFPDPLATETVQFNGTTYPLAADFTAPIALALAELQPRKVELQRMFMPAELKESARLALLQRYDPGKIPVLLIHGLGDSQATWAPLIETLRNDATFRTHYQIWYFSYATAYPYPLMAAILRQKMDEINIRYPDHKPIVVIGHSMGGMIARTLITDSGLHIWNAYFTTPPAETPLSPEARQILTGALIFRHRPEISRVIFFSASLRGSDVATGFFGRLGRNVIGSPGDLSKVGQQAAALAKPRPDGEKPSRMPNSIDGLDPNSRFLLTINSLPIVKGIPYHSIIADRGKGGNHDHTPPVSTDGLVPYWSSHLDGAVSELVVPSDHWSNRSPQGIAEARRILQENLHHPGPAPKASNEPGTAAQ
ncbi:MAG: alpha/beta fold hydrolase [Chthoniobacter sp.]|nr:alpha/beta fold hydrolase [Chthoniobacter sp.]